MGIKLTEELGMNFIEYAVAVNTDRAIPSAKDGLKPVQKRILWSMLENGRTSNKPHLKCARVVGDSMSYHPHGNSSIYGALVRLSQPWIMRYPLIDFHGNMGNIIGDGPAASRYTEARLGKISEKGMLNHIKEQNVSFGKNYDETLNEPNVLPAIFPNLLCNPTAGIGVATATTFAPHNLAEVARAINDYLDGEEPMLPGPDFPTGGTIINRDDIPAIMKSGKGSVRIRGNYTIKGNDIVFYEIPYGTTVEGILTDISKMIEKEEITGISSIQDNSGKQGLNITVSCSRGEDPAMIVKQLFAKTKLQSSFSYNQVALINKTPVLLSLSDAIDVYIGHNVECIVKEIQFKKEKKEKRLEIVNGLVIALAEIDEVIRIIKTSANKQVAKEQLVVKYSLKETQAEAILNMKLSSLAKLQVEKLNAEKKTLLEEMLEMKKILSSQEKQIQILRDRLAEVVNLFGDKRRTRLEQLDIVAKKINGKSASEAVMEEETVLTLYENGSIKRGVRTVERGVVKSFSCSTLDTFLLFTRGGNVIKTQAYSFSKEKTFYDNHVILDMCKADSDQEVLFFTKEGRVKRTLVETYNNDVKLNKKMKAIKLKTGDSINKIQIVNRNAASLFSFHGNEVQRILLKNIRTTLRNSSGSIQKGLSDTSEIIQLKKEKAIVISQSSVGKMYAKVMPTSDLTGRIVYKDHVIKNIRGYQKGEILKVKNPRSIKEVEVSTLPMYKSKTSKGVQISDRESLFWY